MVEIKCTKCGHLNTLELKCLKCGNEWSPRKDRPKKCPNCGNKNYDEPKRAYVKKEGNNE